MDKKLKSIAWVGKNISQKFETMCQQVDNIVSQDTVKYVENQMQTMGGSVKRFYSDVVLDLLPPLADPIKHEAQEVVVKRNDAIGTCIKSVIGIDENSANTIIKQSQEEPDTVDQMKNQLGHTVSGNYVENQLKTPTSVDPVDGTESDVVLEKIDNVLTHDICDVDVEENASKENTSSEVSELMFLGHKKFSEASSFCESIDCNNKNACGVVVGISQATSDNIVEFQPTQRADTVCDNFADNSMSVSDASNVVAASEMALSVTSCEEKISETRLMSSSYSRLMESNNLHENSLDAVDGIRCGYDSCEAIPSSTSSPIVLHKDKEAEAELINSSSVSSLESNEEDVSITDYTKSLIDISQKTNDDFCGSSRFEALGTTSDDGPSHDYSDCLDYSGMETIELCDNVKLEDSCVMVDNSALYAVSNRTQKLRSFKKRIQDALTSKRRLAKEYEQLAIWFGDVYMGASQDTLQSLLPSTTSATSNSENSSKNHICDSEWELL